MRHTLLEASKYTGALIAGLSTFLWGKPDVWLYALFAFISLDYVSSLIAAAICANNSGKIGLRGITKKILSFILVAVAHILDIILGLNGTLRSVVIGFLISNEGISILTNCTKCGVPIPDKIVKILNQLKDQH